MDFKPIETQEELNGIIESRVKREREKYADYEDLKTQVSGFDETKKTYEQTINELQTKADSVEELMKKNQQLEINSMKLNIAVKNGLPLEMANRLAGTTEEELNEDATKMASFIVQKRTQPLKNTEKVEGNTEDEAYRRMLKKLKGEQ